MAVLIDGWPFDLAIREESALESELTKHPIDAGSDIADHVIDGPLTLTLECVVSDTPTGAIATHATRQAASAESPLVSDAAWDKLLEIRAARRAVTIETGRRTLDRMVLTSMVDRRDVASSGGALFTVTFEQATIVENKRVTVRVAVPMVKKKATASKQPKRIPGKRILWRKGKPPGRSPATDPPGEIVGQETIVVQARQAREPVFGLSASQFETIAQNPLVAGPARLAAERLKQSPSQFLHEDGKSLTTAELEAFLADYNRDQALESRRKLATIDRRLDATEDRIQRALKYADARDENPGKYIDPKLFGL